jgi:hypothetical protein
MLQSQYLNSITNIFQHGINTSYQLVHATAGYSITMFASPSTRLPTSNPTLARFVVSNGAQMVLNSPQAATTTLSQSGMHAALLHPSSRRQTTMLQSRRSPGVLGSTTSSPLAVVATTVISTSGTPPPALASTPSTPAAKSLAYGGALTTRRSRAPLASQTTAFQSGHTHRW